MGHSIKLHGGASFDWMFATSDPSKLPDGNLITAEPVWGGATSLLATFSDGTAASNYGSAFDSIVGYRIYKKADDSRMIFVADVGSGTKELRDYCVKSGDRVSFLIYPIMVDKDGNTSYTAPATTDAVLAEFYAYTLIELLPGDGKAFTVGSYVWHFYINAELSDFSHNMQTSIQETHTKYPHIRRTAQNYISGSLSAYAGSIIEDGRYVEDQSVFDKWSSFLDSTNPKLLTDPFGHKYIVEITGSYHKTEDYSPAPTTISFDFTEIANADDYSVYEEIAG